MKLKALALGVALAFPMMASAQSSTSVTLYGTVDTAIEYVNNIPDGDGDKHSSVHFTNLTQSWPSHWGLRGTEDLGNGLKAVFTLESGFNTGTGTSGQGGRLFGRQAYVGLAGDWGQIAFGRQYNMLMRSMLGADILGPNAYGLGTLDSYIPNARMDNSITYMGNFSGFKVGAAWARGRDTVLQGTGNPGATGCGVDYTDQSACGAWSAMLGYDAANWGVAAGYDVIRGSGETVAGNWNGLTRDEKDRRWNINGYVKFGDAKIGLIYLNRKNDAGLNSGPFGAFPPAPGESLGDRSDIWTLNASYQVSPAVKIDGSVNYMRFKDADESSKNWYYVARATYSLSKRTSVYTSAAYIRNKGLSQVSAAGGTNIGPGAVERGGNQTAIMAGLRHNF